MLNSGYFDQGPHIARVSTKKIIFHACCAAENIEYKQYNAGHMVYLKC
jgi:hypothetical protein